MRCDRHVRKRPQTPPDGVAFAELRYERLDRIAGRRVAAIEYPGRRAR